MTFRVFRCDGIERSIGWRVPGTICGEVPLACGGLSLGSYRAAGPSRVIRVDVQQYYAIAGAVPEIAEAEGINICSTTERGKNLVPDNAGYYVAALFMVRD